MEIHTRDAKEEVALAQLGAAVILLWHHVPKFMQADLLHVAETIAVCIRSLTPGSGCSA